MKIILKTDVAKVGQRGSVVEVSDGYAMNVLIPQGKALPATREHLKAHDRALAERNEKSVHEAENAKMLLESISGKKLVIEAKASDTGTLFKAIHASDISDEIRKQWKIEISESAIKLEHPIKQKGEMNVIIGNGGFEANVTVVV